MPINDSLEIDARCLASSLVMHRFDKTDPFAKTSIYMLKQSLIKDRDSPDGIAPGTLAAVNGLLAAIEACDPDAARAVADSLRESVTHIECSSSPA